jgi:hypothetical protein
VGDNAASRVGDVLWFGPLKGLQKLFFHTPLVHAFSFGSELYHDYYRWPFRDRAVFDVWRRTTEWGALFDSYAHPMQRFSRPAAAFPERETAS